MCGFIIILGNILYEGLKKGQTFWLFDTGHKLFFLHKYILFPWCHKSGASILMANHEEETQPVAVVMSVGG